MTTEALANEVGVARQAIWAMEAGEYTPNTGIALKLARALGVAVGDLFQLKDVAGQPEPEADEAMLISPLPAGNGNDGVLPGQPVQVCEVGGRLVATTPDPAFPLADGVLTSDGRRSGTVKVRPFASDWNSSRQRILLAGCDPGVSVLRRRLSRSKVDVVSACRNSTQSLELLAQSMVHVAGLHLRDTATGESNLHAVRKRFPKGGVAVVAYAFWNEGIVVAHGNPKGIRDVADLARNDVKIVNREAGSGIRAMLDSRLREQGIPTHLVNGYDDIAPGHLPAAWQVKAGLADCCLATEAVARAFGLGFVALERERYDLAVRTRNLEHRGVRALLDTLGGMSFRREVECLGGYDASVAGDRRL